MSDEDAQQFFSDFYKFYKQADTTNAEAVQQAQKNLLSNERMKHPFFGTFYFGRRVALILEKSVVLVAMLVNNDKLLQSITEEQKFIVSTVSKNYAL